MILKEFTTRILKVKTFLKYAHPLKRYSVLKFEFPVILWDLYRYKISSEYSIYSIKRRTWSGKVNKRRSIPVFP